MFLAVGDFGAPPPKKNYLKPDTSISSQEGLTRQIPTSRAEKIVKCPKFAGGREGRVMNVRFNQRIRPGNNCPIDKRNYFLRVHDQFLFSETVLNCFSSLNRIWTRVLVFVVRKQRAKILGLGFRSPANPASFC